MYFKSALFVFFLITCSHVKAQLLRTYECDTMVHPSSILKLSGNLDYSASSIENGVLSPLIFGGYISSEVKEQSLLNHQGFQVLGAEIQGDLFYYNQFNRAGTFGERFLPGFHVGYSQIGSLAYTPDLFKLAFYGNEVFQGEYCTLSGTRLNWMGFQNFGVSFYDKKNKASLGVNLVGLTNYNAADFSNNPGMRFYYTESGDSLYGICNASTSYFSRKSYFKGYGFSLDFDFQFNVQLSEDHSSPMKISIRNLGMVSSPNLTTQSLDTSFAFGGFTISELIQRQGILSPNFSFSDSLTEIENNNRWLFLPASIQLISLCDPNRTSRFQPLLGLRMIFTPGYIPFVYAGINGRLHKNFNLSLCGSYGGFSGFKLNTAFQFQKGAWAIGMGSDNFLGLFLKQAFGKAISIQLRCVF